MVHRFMHQNCLITLRDQLISDYKNQLYEMAKRYKYNVSWFLCEKVANSMIPSPSWFYVNVKTMLLDYLQHNYIQSIIEMNKHPWRQLSQDNTYFTEIINIQKFCKETNNKINIPLDCNQHFVVNEAGLLYF